MKYLCLIYQDEALWERMADAEVRSARAEDARLRDEAVRSGRCLAGDRLGPTSSATTVRVRGGRASTSDGPCAQTPEQLGGYFLIEADHLDEAIDFAVRIPGARFGSVEVRPIVEAPEPALRC